MSDHEDRIESALARLTAEIEGLREKRQAELLEGCCRFVREIREHPDGLQYEAMRSLFERIRLEKRFYEGDDRAEREEKWLRDNAPAIDDANRYIDTRGVKIGAMQARVDEARSSPDDTRTADELEEEAFAAMNDRVPGFRYNPDGPETQGTAEVDAERVLSTPMRIQDLLRDAEPQRWEIQAGGAFIAQPADHVTLHAEPRRGSGWCWRIDGQEQPAASGNASSPALAVASAEAAYALMKLGG